MFFLSRGERETSNSSTKGMSIKETSAPYRVTSVPHTVVRIRVVRSLGREIQGFPVGRGKSALHKIRLGSGRTPEFPDSTLRMSP